MRYNLITILCFLFFQQLFAQVKTSEVVQLFSKGGEVSWEISVDNSPKQTLLWQERPNSIKGIKTFVCYQNGEMIGVLSADNQGVSGNLKLLGKSYDITSEGKKVIVAEEKTEKDGKCGTCCGGGEHSHTARPMARPEGQLSDKEKEILKFHSVRSDGVLREYRLALLITNKYFSDKFKSNVQEVKKFWASTEAFLNELYHRDVSVRFEIVNDERLIYKTASTDPFHYAQTALFIHNNGTTEINKLISENDYDVGVVIHPQVGTTQGLGSTAGVYEKFRKAQCFAMADGAVIAHEIGHLFGTLHTFTNGGSQTYYSEPSFGMSVMGYNSRSYRDYFSLVSIAVIREKLAKIGYYTDKNRTQLVSGEWNSNITNIPYGIKLNNTAPIINTAKIKKEYTLPQNTFFQFYIPAQDAEQQKLYYYAHQVGGYGFPYFTDGSAKFLALKSTQTGRVSFERSYYRKDLYEIENSSPTATGTYHFWLAVNDANTSDKNHGVYYDQAYTKVNIVAGTPFKMTSGYKQKYNAGEKVTFKWNVDANIFGGDSKVRILMSDDFGETYKYTLLASAPNNGTAEVTIPHISLGRKTQFGSTTSGLGIIKIEVIDHIAHDITNNNPNNGGFEIQASAITFQNTPEPTIEVKKGQVPEKANVMAVSTCGGGSQSITPAYKEEETDTLITRTWTATDSCNNTAVFIQYIYIQEDTTSPTPQLSFANFPANVNLPCTSAKPQAETKLQISGCEGTTEISVTHTDTETGNCKTGKTIERTYTASACGQTISQKQTITIAGDNEAPIFSGMLPQDVSVEEGKIPLQTDILATDNCTQSLQMVKSSEEIIENGQKIIIYRWTATDICGNQAEYVQRITVLPKNTGEGDNNQGGGNNPPSGGGNSSSEGNNPPSGGDNNQGGGNNSSNEDIIIYNGVSTENTSENYLKIEPIDRYTDLHIEIFNELGQKVFQAKDYQRKGGVFRGYANIKGVVGKGKRLPSGTYFYILEYKDTTGREHTKKGYLYVR
ncbi:reprolysin-like metallopeptidase [Capnocytophaga stomatis]|uniref:reprolysin-like metallopeptidase n=1 Tax=Capnocytophaga stomatis TaxID=1848904 RepID=UPI001950C2D7|nr:gliding motility-associated C-terminal domain-containing protein [Capnocytophaga stomatis]